MKRLFFILVPLGAVVLSCSVFGKPSVLSFVQLVSQRELFNGKAVRVVGYFDAIDVVLVANKGSTYNPVAVDLSRDKVRSLKQKNLFKSGYVRVAGKFESVGTDKVVGHIGRRDDPDSRIVTLSPAGFRGAYRMQMTEITEFEFVSHE
jgi:hypothetical protein